MVAEGAGRGPLRALSIICCVICAVAAFGLALKTNMDVYMFGFPDGHVTDYQKAADAPLRVLAWVQAGLSLLFLALALPRIGTRLRTVAWLAALVVLVLVAIAAHIGVPWYFGTHLGLDNGIGG
ncbi:hypothetical protein A5662_09205 [Mycobacteriaceae bacterium 1482268.1]|nr:hypothetical protein A5662_09205 [Mycobacteriaceae bacterium 1482268.1]